MLTFYRQQHNVLITNSYNISTYKLCSNIGYDMASKKITK